MVMRKRKGKLAVRYEWSRRTLSARTVSSLYTGMVTSTRQSRAAAGGAGGWPSLLSNTELAGLPLRSPVMYGFPQRGNLLHAR